MASGGIKAIIAAQLDNSGIKKAEKEFSKLGKTIKGALGAVGIGIGLNASLQALKMAGKAAADDAKSQGLLANALRNTVGATNEQIASVEASIKKMETMSSVADDQIRPAFAQLTRVTGDVGKATQLTDLALNVAAGTGRDLASVTIALGKAYQGNSGALARLGINVKGVKDPLDVLQKQFAGAAEQASKLDPYQRLSIVMQNLQEQIGTALLPYLNHLADYFASKDGQLALGKFAENVGTIATSIFDLAGTIASSGIIDKLTNFLSVATKVATLDIKGAHDVAQNNIMQGYVDSYVNNRAQFNKDLAAIKQADLDYYKQIMAYVNKNKPATGQGGSVLDSYTAATGKVGGFGTVVSKITTQIPPATKVTTGLAKANTAAADAAKAAADAAEAQAQAYLDAAAAAQALMDETRTMLASFTALFKVQPDLGAFEQTAVDAFTNIFDTIDSALADGKILSDAAARLREYAKSEQATLQGIARQRDLLAKKIDVARSITSGVMGLVDVTNLLETTSKSVTETVTAISNGISVATTKTFDIVTSGGLVDNFQKLVDKTKAFAKNLVDLKKLGLNKQLFAQLVQAGADAGGATAQALVDGGAETISALNSLYSELAMSASDIASSATDTLYEVGRQVVSNGFIEGLLSQDSELQRAAQTLADAFASTFTGELQSAVNAALPDVNGLGNQVENLGGGGGGLNGGRALMVASMGRGTIYNVNVSAGVVTDPNALAKTVIDSVKKYERSNGSVWVAA